MKIKQLIGFIAISLGVTFILCAAHGMGYLYSSRKETASITNSPSSPTERYPQNAPLPLNACQGPFGIVVGGGVILIGLGIALHFKEK